MDDRPELAGPYGAVNGLCVNGHALNGYGRCEAHNYGYTNTILDPGMFPRGSCNSNGHYERIREDSR